MNKLLILGKENIDYSIEYFKNKGFEIWLCGTDKRIGADRYYELHGIEVEHENVIRSVPEVYKQGLPINNTISVMLVDAWLEGYTEIKISGCSMTAQEEYIKQSPALAYIIGFLNGKGLNVIWDSLPENINYGA